MKKIISSLLLTLFIFSCSEKSENEYTIDATITGFDTDTMVYINKISDSNRQIVVDSVQMKNGKFTISLPLQESKDFNFISFGNAIRGNILFIPENTDLQITADKNDLRAAEIKGGSENIVFTTFLKEISALNKVQDAINQQNAVARRSGDYEAMKSAAVRTDSLNTAKKELRLRLLKEHPKTLSAVMALNDLVAFKMIDGSEARAFYDSFPRNTKESRLGINAKKSIDEIVEITDTVGDKVSNFSAPSISGENFQLMDNLGKITVLDFWASWCRPCRAENPNVVRIYNKYKSKGLEIIGISFDQKEEKWKEAVANDGLTWKHVSNLKGWQEPLGKPFSVRSIPTTYLLDSNGVIIAKNLRGQALENKIAELLK